MPYNTALVLQLSKLPFSLTVQGWRSNKKLRNLLPNLTCQIETVTHLSVNHYITKHNLLISVQFVLG